MSNLKVKLLELFIFGGAPMCGYGICVRFDQLVSGTLIKIDEESFDGLIICLINTKDKMKFKKMVYLLYRNFYVTPFSLISF